MNTKVVKIPSWAIQLDLFYHDPDDPHFPAAQVLEFRKRNRRLATALPDELAEPFILWCKRHRITPSHGICRLIAWFMGLQVEKDKSRLPEHRRAA